MLVAAIAAGVAFFATRTRWHSQPRVERVPGSPTVNVAAFAGHGRLALISLNTDWVLDGERRRLRRIPTTPGLYPLQPSFSRDGRWLAFVQTRTRPAYVAGGAWHVGQLWLARGDGSGAHPVSGLANTELVGWSSRNDVLAVVAGVRSRSGCPSASRRLFA